MGGLFLNNKLQTHQSIWENRSFSKIYTAFALSTLGDWLDGIAIMLLFGYVWNEGAMVMALIPLAYAVPGIFLGQVSGILADRSSKLKLMLAGDVLQAVFTFLILLQTSPLPILLLLCLRSAAGVFSGPAQQALTRELIPHDQLLKASSMNAIVTQAAKVIGPSLGGILAAATSPMLCILINGTSFLLSAFILLSMNRVSKPLVVPMEKQHQVVRQVWYKGWQEGWAIIFANPTLTASIIFSLLTLTAIQLVDAQFVVVLREFAPGNTRLAGWLISVIGCGALGAVTVIQRFKDIKRYGLLLGSSSLLIGLMLASLSLLKPGQPDVWALIAGFLGGIGTGLSFVGFNYILQKETPQHALGRIYGLHTSLSSVVFVTAPLLGGAMITALGVRPTLAAIGATLILLGLAAISFRHQIWSRKDKLTGSGF
jgi:predicted MFS family arabinose efflux permease